MCDWSHWKASLFSLCHVSGLFWAREWPTSPRATSTGQSESRRLRYLNIRNDSTAVKRSSVQPWIENTATLRPSCCAFQPSSW